MGKYIINQGKKIVKMDNKPVSHQSQEERLVRYIFTTGLSPFMGDKSFDKTRKFLSERRIPFTKNKRAD